MREEGCIRHRRFAPRFLGWSRWEIVLEWRVLDMTMRETLASGSWLWRRRGDRHYREFSYEIAGVSEIHCDDEWIANQRASREPMKEKP